MRLFPGSNSNFFILGYFPNKIGRGCLISILARLVVFYLLPQRFVLPPTGKTHHGGLHHWVSAQERSEVLNEGVLGIDAVEPIGNAAKLRIETVDGEIEISYPSLAHP